MIMPQTLSILVEVFPVRQRAQAIGLWSAVSGIAIVAGPIVGGWLIEHFWWGSVFLVNLPIVAVTVVGTVLLLPNHRDPEASPVDARDGPRGGRAGRSALRDHRVRRPGRVCWASPPRSGSCGSSAAWRRRCWT